MINLERKIQQHYVWEHYLRAWCFNGKQIYCYRVHDKKTFAVNPDKTAKEREFYKIKELSEKEEKVIYEAFIKSNNKLAEAMNLGWLNSYTKIFRFKKHLESKGITNQEIENEIATLIINLEEDHHTRLEQKALPIIESLSIGDTSILRNEDSLMDFCLFLCTQYYRTKKIKNAVIQNVQPIGLQLDVDFKNMWNVVSFIFSTNSSYALLIKKNFKWTLLINEKNTFITSDQPVINVEGKYSTNTVTEKLEFYYPISPNKALLISDINYINEGEIVEINEFEAKKYNTLMLNTCEEQIYFNDKDLLERLLGRV